MFFQNFNEISLLISIILFVVWVLFSWKNYKKNKSTLLLLIFHFAIISLVISLFSPRYGEYNQTIDVEWWNITFVMDVSKSMDVYDISYDWWKISRLEAQKWIISEYTLKNIQNQYSLFAFAAETLEILPYTSDIWLFNTILYWVDKNNVSKYGSEFIWLFDTLGSFLENEDNAGTVVIFTDWWEESNISLKQSVIQKINKNNSKVIIVWLWTELGWYIYEWQDIFGRVEYKTYNWETVISKLNNTVLKNFADKYNFEYYSINNMDNIGELFKNISETTEKTKYEKNISLKPDISYIFIAIFWLLFTLFLIFENIIWRKK